MTGESRKPLGRSVVLAAEKGRAQRVQRLRTSLEQRLENPLAAVDALIAEAGDGDPQPELWERLHAAAMRDGVEALAADAYVKCVNGPRMKRLSSDAQAQVLMHAADFFQGVCGDAARAETFLERVLTLVPGHAEAFGRLERRLEKLRDAKRLLELYATVASEPPKPLNVLATQAFNRTLQLTPKDGSLSEEACRKLLALVPTNPRLLEALEAHCRTTKRAGLACELIEEALRDQEGGGEDADALDVQRRQRLVDLYLGEAGTPAAAMPHVEKLLERDPSDSSALKTAEKLLSVRDVASRAATALQAARRARSG